MQYLFLLILKPALRDEQIVFVFYKEKSEPERKTVFQGVLPFSLQPVLVAVTVSLLVSSSRAVVGNPIPSVVNTPT